MRQIRQVTIRGLAPEVAAAIRRISRDEGISMNKAALKLLSRGANLDRAPESRVIGHDLDHLFGTWTEADAAAFLRSIQSCEQVDEDFWK
jgi:hypothetical protein